MVTDADAGYRREAKHLRGPADGSNFRMVCPGSQREPFRGVILAGRRGSMRVYLAVAGMALSLVALWAALVPLLA
jgi:hypothetical protein